MTTTFADLGLPAPLVSALDKQGFTEPFPIQAATIPDALAGRDVSGKAPTGSGKTLAFGLPILARVGSARPKRPLALVLAPTRELAEQIKDDLVPLARSVRRTVTAIYGGVGYGPQLGALRRGVDVLVATPGRLEDLIQQRAVDLRDVEHVVIDEGDRMADMGFLPAVRRILDLTAQGGQTLLFSATLDGDVAVLSRDYQQDPIRHDAGTVESETIDAVHHFWLVDRNARVEHVADVIGHIGRSIVFTRTRHGADRLSKQLARLDVQAVAMHGGRSQRQRSRSLEAFAAGRVQALIATDVAARGIHVDGVMGVVHFDPPEDAKTYIHRSGRTARAGATGTIVSLVSHDQRRAVTRMQQDLDLRATFDEPRLDALEVGGIRLGAAPSRPEPSRPQRDRTPNGRAPRPTKGSASNDAQSLYVANLPWRLRSSDVEKLFERHGTVHQATVIADRKTGRSRGFGFVEMPAAEARTAIRELHGSTLDGRDLIVRAAEPKKAQKRR
jgi:superfamily II DNA/RNA helicase